MNVDIVFKQQGCYLYPDGDTVTLVPIQFKSNQIKCHLLHYSQKREKCFELLITKYLIKTDK